MLARIKKILIAGVRIWIFVGFLVFIVSFLVGAVGAPRSLELPWSQFVDFVQGKDESVYVHTRFYARVLRYDGAGRFLASYPAPENGHGHLATDINGRIYFRLLNRVYTYDRDWNLLSVKTGNFYGDRTWILNEKGEPEAAPGKAANQPAPYRAVFTGELLFSGSQGVARDHFTLADGSSLYRKGDRLIRYSSNGNVRAKYGTPWYLWWAKFPVPLASSFLALFLWGALENEKLKRIVSSLVSTRKAS